MRKRLSTRARRSLFENCGGVCHICSTGIRAGEAWDVSHVIPLELGGADDASNWDIAHRKCHRVLTAEVDVPAIAKAKRREAAHRGFRAPSARPLPGGRSTPFKKHMDGSVSRRPR